MDSMFCAQKPTINNNIKSPDFYPLTRFDSEHTEHIINIKQEHQSLEHTTGSVKLLKDFLQASDTFS